MASSTRTDWPQEENDDAAAEILGGDLPSLLGNSGDAGSLSLMAGGGDVGSLAAVDSTVANEVSLPAKKRSVARPKTDHCDTTVSAQMAEVISLDERRRKRALDSTVAKGKKGREKVAPANKPKALAGHEWRRQGTGWTLLRSWYEKDETGERSRKREYVQHYSATALRKAETLREKLA